MKLINVLFLACLLFVGLTGCSSNSPEAVAENFITAFYKGDIEKAKQFCTADTQEGVEFMASWMHGSDLKDNMPKNMKVKTVECKLSEDKETAKVTLEISGNYPGKGEKTEVNRLKLAKEDGKWKVVFKAK